MIGESTRMKGYTNAAKRRLIVVIEEGIKLVRVREGDAEDNVRWRQMIGCGSKLKRT